MFKILFFSQPLLKATHLKKVWIPGYTREDGTVVGGHEKLVHVADDHDDTKVAGGHGSASQKKAHKVLSKDAEFGKLSEKDRAAHVMSLATDIQLAATKAAQATFAKQKLVDGKKPSKSEWEALLDSDSQIGHLADVHAAGKLDAYFEAHTKHGTDPGITREKLEQKIQTHVAEKAAKKAARKPKGSGAVDPDQDSLLVAISKLGGLDKDEAKKQGIDPAYFSTKGHGIKRVFHSKGMTFDDMAHNFLSELGYPVTGANDLLEAIDAELAGNPVFTAEGHMNHMAREHAESQLLEQASADEDFGIEAPGFMYDESEYAGMDDQDRHEYELIMHLEQLQPGVYDQILTEANEEGDNAEQLIGRCQDRLRAILEAGGRTGETGAQEGAGESTDGAAAEGAAEWSGSGDGDAGGDESSPEMTKVSVGDKQVPVLSKDGKPIVFYHGGADVQSNKLRALSYFTTDKAGAESYLHDRRVSNDDPNYGRLHAVHLSIKNPATAEDVKAAGKKVGVTARDFGMMAGDEDYADGWEYISPHLHDKVDAVVSELKKRGFDGAYFENDYGLGGDMLDGGSWVTFDPKSVVEASVSGRKKMAKSILFFSQR